MKRCHACRKILQISPPVGRREQCAHCGADLHCCLNCGLYAPGTYNDCREPQAERVLAKDRGNFCDFFVFRDAPPEAAGADGAQSAKAGLDALFRKE